METERNPKIDERFAADLDRAARNAGIPPEAWLVQAAAMLGGVAGSFAGWKEGDGLDREISPNLLLSGGQVSGWRFRGRFMRLARDMQDLLRRKSGHLRTELLEVARHGTAGGGRRTIGSRDVSVHGFDKHREELGSGVRPGEEDTRLRQLAMGDVVQSVESLREEALLRPGFLLEHPDPASLAELLPDCHFGRALMVGELAEWLDPARRRSRRRAGTRGLDGFLSGFDCRRPARPGLLSPLCDHVFVRVSAILFAEEEDLRTLKNHHSSLLGKFVVIGGEGTGGEVPASPEDPLFGSLESSLKYAIMTRRTGLPLVAKFRDAGKLAEFRRRRAEFHRRLDEAPQPVSGLACLPNALAWTVAVMLGGSDADDAVLATAVPVSETLLERHLSLLAGLEVRERKARTADRERKIVERVRRRGPMSYRELVRTFSDQSRETNHPAVRRLVDEGVLELDGEGRLRLAKQNGERRAEEPVEA